MNWDSLAACLDQEIRKYDGADLLELLVPIPPSSDNLADKAKNLELPTRKKVDNAVKAYASGKQLSKLSNIEQYFLEKRFFYGWSHAYMLSKQSKKKFVPTLRSKEDEKEALEWLLIDLWATQGFRLWVHLECIRYVGFLSGKQSCA